MANRWVRRFIEAQLARKQDLRVVRRALEALKDRLYAGPANTLQRGFVYRDMGTSWVRWRVYPLSAFKHTPPDQIRDRAVDWALREGAVGEGYRSNQEAGGRFAQEPYTRIRRNRVFVSQYGGLDV